jgi:hypothetical protein
MDTPPLVYPRDGADPTSAVASKARSQTADYHGINNARARSDAHRFCTGHLLRAALSAHNTVRMPYCQHAVLSACRT